MPPSEHAARKQLIDAALAESGWAPVVPFGQHSPLELVAFEEHPTRNGPADYVLYHRGEPVAIERIEELLGRGRRRGLVAQDPNDEPASVLLARVRREREGTRLR